MITSEKGFVFVSVVGIISFCMLIYFLDKLVCLSKFENYQPNYSLVSGCRVIANGVLTPVEMVREVR